MNKEIFENTLKHEHERKRKVLSVLYKLSPESDSFLDWAINSEVVFKDVTEAIECYLSANLENVKLDRVENDSLEINCDKYDFHLRYENEEFVVDKFHGHIKDNSTAYIDSKSFVDVEEVLSYMKS